MSQVAKSVSALERAFLAILVLELEAMGVRLIGPSNSPAFMAIVGQFARVSQGCQVFRLARGDLPLPPLKRIVINLRGSTSKARAMVMNSTTSSRRSPPSYLATKDCGFFKRTARACWVNPAAFRAPTISSQKAAWSGEWTDLPIPRVAEVISRVS